MVVQSGILPYVYHPSSWDGATSGEFKIPSNQLVQPSAIHFEESMYVQKAEWNRVRNKQSGYKSQAGAPGWFLKFAGSFNGMLNHRTSGRFDPNPSGAYLGSELSMSFYSNFGATTNSLLPCAIHQKVYIEQMRELFDDTIANGYALKGGGWSTGSAAENESGVRVDWLSIYKGYTDACAMSGLYYQDTDIFQSGIMFDRHLDEVRLQPMPFFGIAGSLNETLLSHDEPFGLQRKYEKFHLPPLRPRYVKTDGTFPAGWTSGLEIGLDASLTPVSGIAGHLINGVGITLSGGGTGDDGVTAYLSGVYAGGMDSETYGDSPSYCSLTQLDILNRATIPSGQYRVILGHSGDYSSFPWGLSGSPHRSAIWPWDGNYEPIDGTYNRPNDDFFDVDAQNSSFFVTDHTFIYQHDWAFTDASPRIESGIYWFQTNSGPSHGTTLIDGWTVPSEPTGGLVGGQQYTSGIIGLWGLTKWELGRTQNTVPGGQDILQFWAGSAFVYDRANNYYMKVGSSGASVVTNTASASGAYVRFKQQMTFVDGGVIGPQKSIGGINWHISNINNAAWDGSNWVFCGNIVSGLDSATLSVGQHPTWVRTDTSFDINDAVLWSGGVNIDLGWVHYARNTSEYLSLDRSRDGNEIKGVAGSKYKHVTPSWGNLGNTDAAGSGTYTVTEYTMTYGAGMDAVLNLGATPITRIHILDFFDTEPDNSLHCLLLAFPSGSTGGTSDDSSLFVAALDDSSHPYEVTGCWRLHGAGTTYGNSILGNGFATVDGGGSMDHMEIHVTE